MATVDPSRTSTWQANTSVMLCLGGMEAPTGKTNGASTLGPSECTTTSPRPRPFRCKEDLGQGGGEINLEDAVPETVPNHTENVGL